MRVFRDWLDALCLCLSTFCFACDAAVLNNAQKSHDYATSEDQASVWKKNIYLAFSEENVNELSRSFHHYYFRGMILELKE